MTKFQKDVYNIVRDIKRGQTVTYVEVARSIGRPWAYRAVGNALNKNQNPDIPCHRVVRSDGKIGGYNKGSSLKLKLLKLEGADIRD